jgi:hypothetical protein
MRQMLRRGLLWFAAGVALATILSVSAAAWEREPLSVFHERRAKIADLRLLMGVAVDEG